MHTRQSYQLVTDERRGVVCVLLQRRLPPVSEVLFHLAAAAPSVAVSGDYRTIVIGSAALAK